MKKISTTLISITISLFYSAMLISCSGLGLISTPTPTPTLIPTQTPTSTPSVTPTSTYTPTPIPTPTPSVTPTPAVLPQMQLNVEEGDIFYIRMVSDQEISTTVEGQQQDVLQKIGYGYTYTVTSVDVEGNASIDIVYDWILLEQESELGKVQFDSSDPPEEIPAEAEGFNALLGKGFTIRLNPQGKIMEIEGLDDMYTEMTDDLGITDETEREQMEQLFHDQFGDDALKEQMSTIMMDYPQEAIRVGDTWTQSMESTAIVPLIVETTYSLRSYEKGVATIDAKSILTSDPDAEMLDLGYAKIGYDLSGEQEGTTMLDVETGLTISATVTQTLSGEMIMIIGEEETIVPTSLLGVTTIEMILED